MGRHQRLAIAFASTTLLGVAAPAQFTSEQLALLDPSARAASLCTGTGGASMRAQLAMAAALVQAQPSAAIRLYDGLGKIHFPVSTTNAQAQRYFDQGMTYPYL